MLFDGIPSFWEGAGGAFFLQKLYSICWAKRNDWREQEENSQGLKNQWQMKLAQLRKAVGEGTREVSWIWKEGRWWGEEVQLVAEEMCWCLVMLGFNAKEWEGQMEYTGVLAVDKDMAHVEGACAYALSQVQLYRNIATGFHLVWKSLKVPKDGGRNNEKEDKDGDGDGDKDGVAKGDEAEIGDELDRALEDEEEHDADVEGWDNVDNIPENL
ncbi:hypothetical protein BT96DRAFT_949292 [Gymnopus androsaceus JB14]|uniref:Uncharacterized protein n=1 Tax=Gymnopus androsaceus JB14 TaxID=1447944 RepID=A0A6A4GLL8_9AGAR|nr:hypothetical protein BT96DRAFT_949292 [Gymnopus androsaceus JB14]